jgi:two-component system sensor histidine kinase/response regulator
MPDDYLEKTGDETCHSPGAGATTKPGGGKPTHIPLLEDNPAHACLVQTGLSSAGGLQFEVHESSSLEVEPDLEDPSTMRQMSAEQTSFERGQKLRILLAEDDEINRAIAVALLEKKGHSVVLAENGYEAVSALGNAEFDAVLMDVQMPYMGGFEATAAIREKERSTGTHVPIIAMTAHSMAGDRDRCLAAGMDGYISKPIKPADLFDILGNIVNQRQTKAPVNGARPEKVSREGRLETAFLLASVGGNVELLKKLVALFLRRFPNLLTEIRKAAHQGDAAALSRALHTLKGGAGTFLTPSALRLATDLEVKANAGILTGSEPTLEKLEIEMASVQGQLIALMGTVAS